MRDLSPYVCLYEHCDDPTATYCTSRQWLAHMNESHRAQSWLCQQCQLRLSSEDLYREHLAHVHGMSLEQVVFLVGLNTGSESLKECLFCEEEDDDPDNIRLHMAVHLRQYALLSLPWHGTAAIKSDKGSEEVIANAMSEVAGSSMVSLEDYHDEASLSGYRDDCCPDDNKKTFETSGREMDLSTFVSTEKVDALQREAGILSWQSAVEQNVLLNPSDVITHQQSAWKLPDDQIFGPKTAHTFKRPAVAGGPNVGKGQILNEIFKDLQMKLKTHKLRNSQGRDFYPVNVAEVVFRSSQSILNELYTISVRHQVVRDDEKLHFVDKLAGTAAVAANGSQSRYKAAARIFAVLLDIHSDKPFGPDHPAWQRFINACGNMHDDDEFNDERLPFNLPAVENLLGIQYGRLFFAKQYDYCSPVIEEDCGQVLDLTQSSAPLPYLSESQIGLGQYGTVYAVTIERSHVRRSQKYSSYSPTTDITFARKDIKLERAPDHTTEWSIFQLARADMTEDDNYITRILACFILEDKVSLFMDKADMNLYEFMSTRSVSNFKTKDLIGRIGNVAGAIGYLHTQVKSKVGLLRFYHLGIKPENVLVYDVDKHLPTFKLADFSTCSVKKLEQDGNSSNFRLSDIYKPRSIQSGEHGLDTKIRSPKNGKLGIAATCTSPEALLDGFIDEKSDVWGFGCVLCIYLSWLYRGKAGVYDFMKQREQATGAVGDRFVDVNVSLNAAVRDWLGYECMQADDLLDDASYPSVHHLLMNRVMLIDRGQRFDMVDLHAQLRIISTSTNHTLKARLATISPPVSGVQNRTLPRNDSNQHITSESERSAGYSSISSAVHRAITYTDREPDVRETQIASKKSLPRQQPFTRQMQLSEHIGASANVLAVKGNYGSGRSPGAQRPSVLPWLSKPFQIIRTIITSPDSDYIACLHESSVTLVKVTHKLQVSDCVVINCLGLPLIDCTIGSNFLSLLPASTIFEVCHI